MSVSAARAERQRAIHAGEWRSAISEGGEMYYWHTATRETSWTKPEAMAAEEARREADIAKWEALNNSGAGAAAASSGEHDPSATATPLSSDAGAGKPAAAVDPKDNGGKP